MQLCEVLKNGQKNNRHLFC